MESKAAKKWDKAHQVPNLRRRFINSVDYFRDYSHELYLGGSNPHNLLVDAIDPPVETALELAAGRGDFAIYLLRANLARHVRMVDISEIAVQTAQEKAASQGFDNFEAIVADINTIDIAGKYDLIAFSQSLHHIDELDHVLDQVSHALNSGGIFYVSDYIGPSRMQWSDTQLGYMNDLLSFIPKSKRLQIKPDGTISPHPKAGIDRIPLEMFEKYDPSEAVHSGEIESVIRSTFKQVTFYPMGGSITYELFRNIAHHFDTRDEIHMAFVKTIAYFEHDLITRGILQPCFGIFLCANE